MKDFIALSIAFLPTRAIRKLKKFIFIIILIFFDVELSSRESSSAEDYTTVHIYQPIYLYYFKSHMILLRLSRQFEINYATYGIHLLKHLKHIFLCFVYMISSFHQDSWYYYYFHSVLFKCKNYSRKLCHKEV